jgi:hypothetical protein
MGCKPHKKENYPDLLALMYDRRQDVSGRETCTVFSISILPSHHHLLAYFTAFVIKS